MKAIPYLAFYLAICSIISSCNDGIVFKEQESIPEDGWAYENEIKFTAEISDIANPVDLFIDINHSKDFGYENLYTQVSTIFPAGDTATAVVSLKLTDEIGSSWAGKCKGSSCSVLVPIRKNVHLTETGNYTFLISQYSRDKLLQGIDDIGLNIVQSRD